MRYATEIRRFTEEELAIAKSIDLLTYMQYNEPYNLKKLKGNVYCTQEHDSLKISNGKWFWWSKGIGGKNALSYLTHVKEMSFVEAVKLLIGEPQLELEAIKNQSYVQEEKKEFVPPIHNADNNRAIKYLMGRGIDRGIIDECIRSGVLYETAKFHNVAFIGKDENGAPKFGALRGTAGNKFAQDCAASDKRYSFRIENTASDTLCVFEAAIDLLSYATICKMKGRAYDFQNLLSLSGVYEGSKKDTEKEYKMPVALESFLERNPHISKIALMLDNDTTGQKAAFEIKKLLDEKGGYEVKIFPPASGKDFNDHLLNLKKQIQKNLVKHDL